MDTGLLTNVKFTFNMQKETFLFLIVVGLVSVSPEFGIFSKPMQYAIYSAQSPFDRGLYCKIKPHLIRLEDRVSVCPVSTPTNGHQPLLGRVWEYFPIFSESKFFSKYEHMFQVRSIQNSKKR